MLNREEAWRKVLVSDARPQELEAFQRSVESGWWAYGEACRRLEEDILAATGGGGACIVTKSCTAALAVASRLFECDSAPSLTYPGTYSGFPREPILEPCVDDGWPARQCDVGVDLWGRKFPYLCKVLDAAHNFASVGHRTRLLRGTEAICYSFGPTKELSAPLGGALVLADAAEAGKARDLLNNCHRDRGASRPMGRSEKQLMPEPIAAWLRESIHPARRRSRTQARQDVLGAYEERLSGWLMTRPGEASGHLAVLRMDDEAQRDAVRVGLTRAGIEWSQHYRTDDPVSKRIITLPCHHLVPPYRAKEIANVVLDSV